MNKSIYQVSLNFIGICILNLFIILNAYADDIKKNSELISIGNDNAPVKVKVYSSLTCPHCANFHINVIPKIREKYVKTGMVKIIFIDFPLDLAALNASKILHCTEKTKQMVMMDIIYKKQNEWTVGTEIEEINANLKNLATASGVNFNEIDKCFIDENIENRVLNDRIEGDKKYSISSTPTIIINEKKHTGSHDFENIEKEIKKNI